MKFTDNLHTVIRVCSAPLYSVNSRIDNFTFSLRRAYTDGGFFRQNINTTDITDRKNTATRNRVPNRLCE